MIKMTVKKVTGILVLEKLKFFDPKPGTLVIQENAKKIFRVN